MGFCITNENAAIGRTSAPAENFLHTEIDFTASFYSLFWRDCCQIYNFSGPFHDNKKFTWYFFSYLEPLFVTTDSLIRPLVDLKELKACHQVLPRPHDQFEFICLSSRITLSVYLSRESTDYNAWQLTCSYVQVLIVARRIMCEQNLIERVVCEVKFTKNCFQGQRRVKFMSIYNSSTPINRLEWEEMNEKFRHQL